MKKKLLVIFLAIVSTLALAFGLTACAGGNTQKQPEKTSGSEGLEYTLSNDGEYYICSGIGTCTETEIAIASWYNDKYVTEISSSAFYDCSSLTSVTIGNSVTSIASSAFEGCSSLTNITIPDSVTRIDSYAFSNTAYYNDNNNWENDVLYIGKYLIRAISSISGAYAIKDGTLTIAASAFNNCSNLTSVVIPDSVTTIGDRAFEGCSSLTSVTIPDSVATIGSYAFYYCSNLTSVTIGKSVTSIGKYAFSNCNNLLFNEYDNCQYLGSKTNPYFALVQATNKNYSSYVIHIDTKVIADYAFDSCTRMGSVTIPDSVTSIGGHAFSGCSSLTSVTIGNGVTSIGKYAFYYCSSLTSVTFKNTNGWWRSTSSTATSGTSISSADLADTTSATTCLKSYYLKCYWMRG